MYVWTRALVTANVRISGHRPREATESNSLWDMAGVDIPTTYHWVVDNGTVVAVRNTEDPDEVIEFEEAFQVGWK
jgi:hypothetical protein